MSTATTNLALGKGVGSDNAGTYLKTTLAAALDTIDGKFGGAGGTIPTASLEAAAVTAPKIADLPKAKVYNSAAINVISGLTTLTFDSELKDTDGIHSTASNTGRLTAQTAGDYRITAAAIFSSNATGSQRQLRIILNGTTALIWQSAPPVGGGDRPGVNATCTVTLAVGDYVTVQTYQDSGSTLTVDAVGQASPMFQMELVP
ncbi:MAG: hypothetical protein NUW01_07240 [Gemmatimonadaceae bacterium]|nr:hypothetical protein [Gemmatimonadaceae bacterium]